MKSGRELGVNLAVYLASAPELVIYNVYLASPEPPIQLVIYTGGEHGRVWLEGLLVIPFRQAL